jgi:hypothetical protein
MATRLTAPALQRSVPQSIRGDMTSYWWLMAAPVVVLALVWGLQLYRAKTRDARGEEKWPRQSPRAMVRNGVLLIVLNAIILGSQLYTRLVERRDYGATAYVLILASSLGLVLAFQRVAAGLRGERSG